LPATRQRCRRKRLVVCNPAWSCATRFCDRALSGGMEDVL
jgi:hypothetical protein